MKYYDIEVLSIPAGGTIDEVTKLGIYECPSEIAPYKSRGEHKPLFIAFRREKGRVETLYKLSELISTPLAGAGYESAKEQLDKNLVDRIDGYKKLVNYNGNDDTTKWVFFLDLDRSIPLPNPVEYKRNNSFVETSRPLKDYFAKPNADGIVVFGD